MNPAAWLRAWRADRRYKRAYRQLLDHAYTHLPELSAREAEAWARHYAGREVTP